MGVSSDLPLLSSSETEAWGVTSVCYLDLGVVVLFWIFPSFFIFFLEMSVDNESCKKHAIIITQKGSIKVTVPFRKLNSSIFKKRFVRYYFPSKFLKQQPQKETSFAVGGRPAHRLHLRQSRCLLSSIDRLLK